MELQPSYDWSKPFPIVFWLVKTFCRNLLDPCCLGLLSHCRWWWTEFIGNCVKKPAFIIFCHNIGRYSKIQIDILISYYQLFFFVITHYVGYDTISILLFQKMVIIDCDDFDIDKDYDDDDDDDNDEPIVNVVRSIVGEVGKTSLSEIFRKFLRWCWW